MNSGSATTPSGRHGGRTVRELFAALRHHAETAGRRTAFDDGAARLAYATLARRVAGAAEDLKAITARPAVIGLLGGNRTDWVIGQLAGWHQGMVVVPLPPFFSPAQLGHVIRDAGISHVVATADMAETARLLPLPFTLVADREAAFGSPPVPGGGVITYTSGSTGRPKGVLLQSGQVLWSARTLVALIGADAEDIYLSVLPLALLLETICAVVVPVLAGAQVRLEPALAASFEETDGGAINAAAAAHRPTCMVLVPQLLARWVAHLSKAGTTAPASLRFVAIGGAAVSPALAEQAWQCGIPAHEGYGLSECGSVVSLNAPGGRRAGTVGQPLPGIEVGIDDGEIVVRGPPVMDRYLQGSPTGGSWRTGDLGALDRDGYLRVHGRRDNLLVTPLGRNVSPEWIEALLAADPRIACCLVTHIDGPHLTAVLIPSEHGEAWFARASADAIGSLVAGCCRDVPRYAIPQEFIVLRWRDAVRRDAVTANGRIRRTTLRDLCMTARGSGSVGDKAAAI